MQWLTKEMRMTSQICKLIRHETRNVQTIRRRFDSTNENSTWTYSDRFDGRQMDWKLHNILHETNKNFEFIATIDQLRLLAN